MTTINYADEERSFLYAAFARMLYGETEFLKELAEQDLEAFEQFDEKLIKLLKEAANVPEEELAFQYENLLYIPGHYYAPPFAAQYLYKNDPEKEEQLLREIASWYEVSGFKSFVEASDFKNDHLGHLLMYQHYLLMIKAEAGEEEKQEIEQVLQRTLVDVLNPVFGQFEQKVSDKMKKGFYLDAIQYIHEFIDDEIQAV
ncbi:TorD/DmsD family molecular chaperone [Texcoconibacillus texcoconensis]|uniref:TorA maturation chaperone TorD n=1 Tax=Texcoconibacillus texcoconensis TaxID=1095777 RepID=A0A840QHW1_9BACI|nr:molecular chaperone TorD family protein [Texcoconibacillus texcoconensis]MBB5171924.1 TorA maturation chaperone TorD [Texcoconibacillus texcoconensis]